jgi:hypothetical protein
LCSLSRVRLILRPVRPEQSAHLVIDTTFMFHDTRIDLRLIQR